MRHAIQVRRAVTSPAASGSRLYRELQRPPAKAAQSKIVNGLEGGTPPVA